MQQDRGDDSRTLADVMLGAPPSPQFDSQSQRVLRLAAGL